MLNFGGVQATDVHNEDLFAWHTIDMNHRGQLSLIHILTLPTNREV